MFPLMHFSYAPRTGQVPQADSKEQLFEGAFSGMVEVFMQFS